MLDQILNKVSEKKTHKYSENSYKRHNSNATQQNIVNKYFKPNFQDSILSHNNDRVCSPPKNAAKDHYISFSSKSSMQKFHYNNKSLISKDKHTLNHNPGHISKNISSGHIHPSGRVRKPINPLTSYTTKENTIPSNTFNGPETNEVPTMTTDGANLDSAHNNMFGSRDCSWGKMMQDPNGAGVVSRGITGSPTEGQHNIRSSRRIHGSGGGSGGRSYMNSVNQAFEASYSRKKTGPVGGEGGGGGCQTSNRHLLANKFSLKNHDVFGSKSFKEITQKIDFGMNQTGEE